MQSVAIRAPRLARHLVVALAAASAFTLQLSPARAEAPVRIAPDATEFKLANGLDVVVIPDHRAPIVTHMIWYRVGAADDPPGRSGIAHFLEHLMFKGTSKHPLGEFSARVSDLGGEENAFTTNDATAYHQTIAKAELGTVMAFEADRMEGLVLTDEVVLPERDVILEERRMRIDNDPGAQLYEAMNAALYQNHHYGIPTIGWPQEMATLSREDALAQYSRYYAPENAVLVVAGDVTADEVRRLAETTYGQVPKRAEPIQRERAMEPPPLAERRLTLQDARVAEPSWSRAYLVPSYSSDEGSEAAALDILADVLGRGPTSRLYRGLVVDRPVASSIGAYYAGDGIDYGRFGVVATPRDGVPIDKLEAEIDAVLADLRDHGVTADELDRAKRRTRAAAIFAQDSQGSMARIIGTALVSGQTLAEIQNWPARIDAVSQADVAAAAAKYLDRRRSVTGLLEPAPTDKRS
ncbi:MAG: insulinase family protein [Rhizobiales bacterium]|nr:insulinase family protein [Hyphomicrobiales bacterium]